MEIDHTEGEHAAEALDAIVAPLLKGVDDDFGIAAGAEAVAGGFELFAQISEIVNLAVKGDPDGAVFIAHGLLAKGGVDDGEAAVAEGDVLADEVAVAIGAAVGECGGHGADGGFIRDGFGVRDDAGDAAHREDSYFSSRAGYMKPGAMVYFLPLVLGLELSVAEKRSLTSQWE